MSKLNPISAERKKERRDAVLKEIKAMIFPTVLLAIIALAIVFVMTYQAKPSDEENIPPRAYAGDDKPIVIENSDLKLVMDPLTTTFDVTVKSSGKVWHSVPEDGANDPKAIVETKKKLQSTFLLTYSRQAGLETIYDSYTYSAQNGIYEIETGEDYIRVDYSLGNVEKEYVIPIVAKASELDELFQKMSIKEKDVCKQFYKKYDINNLSKSDAKNKDELLENYPIMADEPIYILRDTTREAQKKAMQGYLETAGYTYDMFLADKELNTKESTSDKPIFNATVIYRLDGDDLVVEVPFAEMESKKDYPIYKVCVLPYFGAGGPDDEGYMLVPSGGGSLINFNNGKTAQSVYYANVYGWDMALSRKDVVHDTVATMNVFGIASGKDSFICILEDGASYAGINADVAGRTSSYNYVNAEYNVKSREQYDVGEIANSEVYVFIENLPDESLVQRYSFIDSNSYVDMAKDYQDYLKTTYPGYFALNTNNESTPVTVEIVGAVDKVRQILGVPVSRPLALTTFEEAEEMIAEISNAGINNLSVKYTGWCNGGVNQKYLNSVKVLSDLGGKKDLQKLSKTAKDLGVDLYLNGVTNYEHGSNIFDGFFSYRDAAKFLSKERAELYKYSKVTYAQREGSDTYFLLHASIINEMIDNLSDAAKKYNTNISFEDVGKDLSSDFYKKDYTSREKAKNEQIAKLQAIDDSGMKIMVNGGNSYAIPYADIVTNVDLKGSEYTILDEVVPFYELAIHGYVDYTGAPINASGNIEEAVLEAAEYGAGLSFSFMKESPFTLQKTLYTEYYGSNYDEIWNDMLEIYERYNRELGHTFNQEMVNHDNLSADVSETVYADGTKVYVNYGFEDYVGTDVKVPARDYLVVK